MARPFGKLRAGHKLFVSKRSKKGDERGLVLGVKAQSGVRMFGQVRIESSGTVHAGVVVVDDLFERGQPSIVHVGSSQSDVAQARHLELAAIGRASCRERVCLVV